MHSFQNRFQLFPRSMSLFLLVLGCWLAFDDVAWAAEPVSPGAFAGSGPLGYLLLAKSWAIGYALVALGILLGMLPVCFPNHRKEKDGKKKKKKG